MEKWKKIAISICAVLVAGYTIFCLSFFSNKNLNSNCKRIEITFSDSGVRKFVSEPEMLQFIQRAGFRIEGETISHKRCHQIEQQALLHPMIRTACCYMSPDGTMHLILSQRIPVLRVLGADNYYVDSDRKIMRTRSSTASYVPIVTGRVPQHLAQGELFDFVSWLRKDDFWSAQITQINVNTANNIELIPRVGNSIILMGNIDDYEIKLSKLKTLYNDGFSKFGWKEYSYIDLRFKGQVVCR